MHLGIPSVCTVWELYNPVSDPGLLGITQPNYMEQNPRGCRERNGQEREPAGDTIRTFKADDGAAINLEGSLGLHHLTAEVMGTNRNGTELMRKEVGRVRQASVPPILLHEGNLS